MRPGPASIAARVLAGGTADPLAEIALCAPSAEARAVAVFVHLMSSAFDDALDLVSDLDGPLAGPVGRFAGALCRAEVPDLAPAPAPAPSGYDDLIAFLEVETAMSAGQIAGAEEAARAVRARPGAVDDLYAAWNQVALARSLAFQGRFVEARAEIGPVLGDSRLGRWPALERIAAGVHAFLCGHDGERAVVTAYSDRLRAEPAEPRTYLESAAFGLAAFAEQAVGRPRVGAALLLRGGGGPFLPRLQVVDRVYGYEILVEAELTRDDVAAAQTWVELAEALPVEGHDMAAAAVGRARARIASVCSDHGAAAEASAESARRAAIVGGLLEVLRGQVLEATARSAADQVAGPAALQELAELAASSGAAMVKRWAERELKRHGRRVRNVPGEGWTRLSERQQLVARLAAQGMRNREIAEHLIVSERTVEGHVAAILDALGAPTRIGIGRHVPDPEPRQDARTELSPRQREVAVLVSEGRTNREIGYALRISDKTVEKHVADVFTRLGVRSRSAVAALLRDVG